MHWRSLCGKKTCVSVQTLTLLIEANRPQIQVCDISPHIKSYPGPPLALVKFANCEYFMLFETQISFSECFCESILPSCLMMAIGLHAVTNYEGWRCWHFSKCSDPRPYASVKSLVVVRRLKKLQLSKLLHYRRGRVWHVLCMRRHQPHVVIVSWKI